MKNLYTFCQVAALLTLSAICTSVHADHLTPEEALRRAENSSVRRMPALQSDNARMSLAFTQYEYASQDAAVYVFHRPSGNGFMLLAADDNVGDLVLGYSDTSHFDPSNIPAGMQCLLAAYADYVSQARVSPKQRAVKEGRIDVSPIVQAQWSQSNPYNNYCPVVEGAGRCVTGCVATAMSQIMRFHRYPEQGQGSYTHTFKYKDTEYTTSADFGSTVYDWEHMTYTYNSTSTNEENSAVATLMHHCGVASRMKYDPYVSTTNALYAGVGWLKYFGYDRSMTFYKRAWFTDEEWDEIIYQQVVQGLPMMYEGYTSTYAGHEFVCDGYRAIDGYYHINWGWGGSSNGYYMLDGLTPGKTGSDAIGSKSGYNFEQAVLCNIRPDVGSELSVTFYLLSDLSTDKSRYDRNASSVITVNSSVISATLDDVTVDVALQCSGLAMGNDICDYIPLGKQTLEPTGGFGRLQVPTTKLPKGEFEVRYVYSIDGGNTWKPVYYDKRYEDCLHLVVTDTEVTVVGQGEDIKLDCFLEKTCPADASDKEFYPGHAYDISYIVKADEKWEGELACVVLNQDSKEIAVSAPEKVSLDDNSAPLIVFRVTLPEDMAEGQYFFALATVGEKVNTVCSGLSSFRVVTAVPEDAFALPTYKLTVDRGYLPAAVTNNRLEATNEADAGRYALLDVPDKNGEFYLYCVDSKMFIKSTAFSGTNAFIAKPDGTFKKTAIGTSGRFTIASTASGNYLQFGGSKQLVLDTWKTLDAGNQWTINEIGLFDATDVYNLLGWPLPSEEDAILIPSATTEPQRIFNLIGQPVTTPRHGLYIIGRKKTLIK